MTLVPASTWFPPTPTGRRLTFTHSFKMLARLSIGSHEALHLSSQTEDDDKQALTVNIDLLMQDIVFRIPIHGDAQPRYDVNCIEKLFSDLEQTSSEMEDDELDILSTCDFEDNLLHSSTSASIVLDTHDVTAASSSRTSRRRRSPSPDSHCFAIPEIIITPCDEPPDMSCRVPLQDSAYNQRLRQYPRSKTGLGGMVIGKQYYQA
ncbi:hypothetical protein CPB85DRAFT_1560563 [Mucidula mucida]|nr:hypothetical protein CPB85DRAFT_1560563 [Mucidula mucida]